MDSNITLPTCFVPDNTTTFSVFHQIVCGYMTTAAVIFGTLGNIYAARRIHTTNLDRNRGIALAVSMINLAAWDTILLWSAFFYYALKLLPVPFPSGMLNIFTYWFHPMSQIANTASIWSVVAITVQRFMATRNPFRTSSTVAFQSFRSNDRKNPLCFSCRKLFHLPLAVSIFAIFLNMTTFFELTLIDCFNYRSNMTETGLRLAPLRHNANYKLFFRVIIRMLVISIGPNIFILCVTCLTIYLLKMSNERRREMFQMTEDLARRSVMRENRQTVIATILVVKFLLMRSLMFYLDITELIKNEYSLYTVDLSNFMVICNSASNWFLFLRVTSLLEKKSESRKITMRKSIRSNSVEGQVLIENRVEILLFTWKEAQARLGHELGLRILLPMLRTQPSLCETLFSHVPQKLSQHDLSQLLSQTTAISASIALHGLNVIAQRIADFISELLSLTHLGQPEEYIILRLRRAGAVHYQRGLHFSSSVWKQLKESLKEIISENEFSTDEERQNALDAWNYFASFIIREMKMGEWALDDSLGSASYG